MLTESIKVKNTLSTISRFSMTIDVFEFLATKGIAKYDVL